MKSVYFFMFLVAACGFGCAQTGIRMVDVAPGTFAMGSDGKTPADYDEVPRHMVRLTHGFRISATAITVEQWRRFRSDYQPGDDSGVAAGLSWWDATAYCAWLSGREGKHYRLPTEAEWEYAAQLPEHAKSWISGRPEWVFDLYGPYGAEAVVDPKGVGESFSRVVRGGSISVLQDTHADPQRGAAGYFSRATNRASVAPGYAGRHRIGFRIVEGEDEGTLRTARVPFPERMVLQEPYGGPQVVAPHFATRPLLPIPPENMLPETSAAAGIQPGVLGHMHSAGAAACANGDVLWIGFSSLTPDSEYSPSTVFAITRLRHGSDRWDMPEIFYDFADVNEQSAMLWNHGGTLRFFGGGAGLDGVPFREQDSKDCGATWSQVKLPLLRGSAGGFTPQPITSGFRKGGAMFVATDATPDSSMLWKSNDEGESWVSAGDRTRGRHTTFVTLRDGSILGMGGKNTNLDGYMPQFLSRDDGKTWTESKTVFPPLNVNQRPTLIRLKSGRLFFACDWQNRQGKQPAGFTEHGALVALSDDEGKTWKIRTLPGVLPHEAGRFRERKDWSPYFNDYGTIGYAIATQTPDGLVHLIGSMTHPSQEFEMNEAWILSGGSVEAWPVTPAVAHVERYASGTIRSRTRGKTLTSGQYVLDGAQTWFFEDGQKQYEVAYANGVRVGEEKLWATPGEMEWTWRYTRDRSTWTQFWPNGKKRHVSHWQGVVCEGEALDLDPAEKVRDRFMFQGGEIPSPQTKE